jgi:hypothetical protein
MLRGIKNASSTWLGKGILAVVISFLVISFAIWGIGDIFRGFGRNAVAAIGDTEISIEQFRQYYTERLQQIGRQMGRPLTSDQARALGLDRQILGQMVAEITLDEQARKLRLGLADAAIAERITTDPAFQGLNGQFDRNRFEQIIRQAGYTEGRFVAEQRNVMLRRQIAQTVSGELGVPKTMLSAINQYQNERRDIEYLALGPAQAGDIPQPTPEQLASYFDERKVMFRAPEYRKVTLLPLAPAELERLAAIVTEHHLAAVSIRAPVIDLVSYDTLEEPPTDGMVLPSALEEFENSDPDDFDPDAECDVRFRGEQMAVDQHGYVSIDGYEKHSGDYCGSEEFRIKDVRVFLAANPQPLTSEAAR